MASVNPLSRELVFKIVYYGPGLGGKTTTLEHIHATAKPDHRGKLVSLATPVDRTLYFDFLPMRLPPIRGMHVRLQLFTVPGQVYFNATRKLVLTGADGIVFVADSQTARADANLESLDNLRDNLADQGRNLSDVPLVFQYNKHDLSDVLSVAELDKLINRWNAPSLATSARTGLNVYESLERITHAVLASFETQMPESVRVSAAAAFDPNEEGLAAALRSASHGEDRPPISAAIFNRVASSRVNLGSIPLETGMLEEGPPIDRVAMRAATLPVTTFPDVPDDGWGSKEKLAIAPASDAPMLTRTDSVRPHSLRGPESRSGESPRSRNRPSVLPPKPFAPLIPQAVPPRPPAAPAPPPNATTSTAKDHALTPPPKATSSASIAAVKAKDYAPTPPPNATTSTVKDHVPTPLPRATISTTKDHAPSIPTTQAPAAPANATTSAPKAATPPVATAAPTVSPIVPTPAPIQTFASVDKAPSTEKTTADKAPSTEKTVAVQPKATTPAPVRAEVVAAKPEAAPVKVEVAPVKPESAHVKFEMASVKPAPEKPAVAPPSVKSAAMSAPPTPAVSAPVVTPRVVTAPAVTAPVVTAPAVTAPVVAAPAVAKPVVAAPAVTKPLVAAPAVTTPAVTTPVVTTPNATGQKHPSPFERLDPTQLISIADLLEPQADGTQQPQAAYISTSDFPAAGQQADTTTTAKRIVIEPEPASRRVADLQTFRTRTSSIPPAPPSASMLSTPIAALGPITEKPTIRPAATTAQRSKSDTPPALPFTAILSAPEINVTDAHKSTGLSFAELWPEVDRSVVHDVENAIAAGRCSEAIDLADTLVNRVLTSTATLFGSTDTTRDAANMPLLLGIDGRRYLAFRSIVRASRSGAKASTQDALAAYAFAIEARMAKGSIR